MEIETADTTLMAQNTLKPMNTLLLFSTQRDADNIKNIN